MRVPSSPIRTRSLTDEVVLAYRRAARAVACFEYGADVHEQTLDAEQSEAVTFKDGRAAYLSASVDDPHARERAHGEKEVRITLAARLSCKRLGAGAGAESDASAEDLARAREIVWYLAGGWETEDDEPATRLRLRTEADAYLKLLGVQTERFLDKRWSQIKAVAEALIEKRVLSEREVRHVIVRSLLAGTTPPGFAGG